MIRESLIKGENPFEKNIEYVIDGKVVGFLKYSLIYDRIEIDNIFVEEDYRNRSIATKLMSRLISIAIENKAFNITLEVRVSNEIAIKLYKKFGFIEVATRRFYYGDEDAILMEKKVM